MKHCADGAILAQRDGALIDADDRLHIEQCGICAEGLEEATRRADWIAETLFADAPAVDTVEAKRAVRARLDGLRAAERPRRPNRTLSQAAALVLLGAVGASALPNSPVRSWVEARAPGPRADAPALTAATEATETGEHTIDVAVGASGLLISLQGVPEASQVEIEWTDGTTARITAADGSSFSIAEGRVESVVTGGPVRLVLPAAAGPLRLEVNGRRLLSRSGDEVELPEGSVVDTPERLILRVPQY